MRMRLKGANASEKCWVFDGFCLFSGESETPSKMGMVANQLFVAPYLCLYMDWICDVGDSLKTQFSSWHPVLIVKVPERNAGRAVGVMAKFGCNHDNIYIIYNI